MGLSKGSIGDNILFLDFRLSAGQPRGYPVEVAAGWLAEPGLWQLSTRLIRQYKDACLCWMERNGAPVPA